MNSQSLAFARGFIDNFIFSFHLYSSPLFTRLCKKDDWETGSVFSAGYAALTLQTDG